MYFVIYVDKAKALKNGLQLSDIPVDTSRFDAVDCEDAIRQFRESKGSDIPDEYLKVEVFSRAVAVRKSKDSTKWVAYFVYDQFSFAFGQSEKEAIDNLELKFGYKADIKEDKYPDQIAQSLCGY